ncbi:response regulator [Streptomyces nodosus]|uniref:response regulator n=1 Tax=Streptomyces nodosus TaxID=40318 RepID=UPI003811F6D6
MISIMIADDHALVVSGLTALLDAEHGMSVAVVVTSAEEVMPAARETRPDVALLDIQLPGEKDGIEITAELRAELHRTQVVVMTGVTGAAGQVRRAQRAGAAGFLAKTAPIATFVAAIRKVAQGGSAYDPVLLTAAAALGPSPLTPREHQILVELARGADTKRIARSMGLALGTVRNHQTALLAKLGMATPLAAVRAASANGWLNPGQWVQS